MSYPCGLMVFIWINIIDIIKREKGGMSFEEIYFHHPWWVWRYHNGEPGKDNQVVFKEVFNYYIICNIIVIILLKCRCGRKLNPRN